MPNETASLDIAVLVPCYNEAVTIQTVVADLRSALPDATIYVYDNGSTDDTAARAEAAGAVVRAEPRPGKGNVVRRMFADIDADVYVIMDGDATYDASATPAMVKRLVDEKLDMVVGARQGHHRRGHGFGNRLFNFIYRRLIGTEFNDIFSGLRAFSRRYVKSFPAISTGFEVETEMSVHASLLRMPVLEMETRLRERPAGSVSKLHTVRDAIVILKTIIYLFKEVRPALFFGALAVLLAGLSIGLGIPLVETYLEIGLVPRFPTAILATGLMLMAGLSLGCGLILDSLARSRLEQKRMVYLGLSHLKHRP